MPEARSKKRIRTADAQVLRWIGRGCSPMTGPMLETTISPKRLQQNKQNEVVPSGPTPGEAASLGHKGGEFARQASLNAGELVRGNAHFVIHLHDVLARDPLEILLPWRSADAAELDRGGTDQEFLVAFLEVERRAMLGAGEDVDPPFAVRVEPEDIHHWLFTSRSAILQDLI